MDQETREKLKCIAEEIAVVEGKRERANEVMNESERYGVDMYLKHINETALELVSIVKKADRLLSDFLKERKEA